MPDPKRTSPAYPQALAVFQEELARTAGLPGLAAPGPALWPRFVEYYLGLTRLPRKLRRALQRRWRRSLGGIALLCALGQAPALAADISVGGGCTLVDAITAANNNTATGGCSAGSGPDLIRVPAVPSITLTTANNDTYGATGLPVITSEITISGGVITRDSSAPPFRILAVGATGNLRLRNTTVSGGEATGDGGGIDNRGTLTLFGSTVSGNTASDYNGGGIRNSGTLTLEFSTVSGNTASVYGGFGGGIVNSGTLTLTYYSTVSGNTASDYFLGGSGGGIVNSRGALTLTNSTVSGNTALPGNDVGFGGGIITSGPLTLTNSTIASNTASYGGGISNSGTLTLTNSTIEANSAQTRGGGILNTFGFDVMLTVTGTSVMNNTAGTTGGGLSNDALLTLTNSTISGNSAGDRGGGVDTTATATLSNSTVSGNSAGDRGAGVHNTGTATLTNSTVSRNASGRVAGGVFNTGTVTLVQSLLSGNTAPVNGPEAYSIASTSGPGTVIADGFNVFGHDGSAGVAGFTLGPTDRVPAVPIAGVLDPALAYNGGATRTHALVFASPAVDAVLGAACATATDQRGAPRAQDGDGDTLADCDSGAVERGLVPVQAELAGTRLDCRGVRCGIPVTCNLTEAQCANEVEVVVRTRALRAADGTVTKAARRIRFATGVTNVPSGGTGRVTLRLTKQGKRLVRATKKKRLKGVLGIREIAATASNTPVTINNTRVVIRLRRR